MRLVWLTCFTLISVCPCITTDETQQSNDIAALLITQAWPYELGHATQFEEKFRKECGQLGWNATVLQSHADFDRQVGGWSLWPLLSKLVYEVRDTPWLFVAEAHTKLDLHKLKRHINSLSPDDVVYMGKALVDSDPVIIHHFFGVNEEKKIKYPDFSAGLLLSREALKRINAAARQHEKNDFTIDAKFEFAKFIYDNTGLELEDSPLFCLQQHPDCLSWYEPPTFNEDEPGCGPGISKDNVFYAVKTFHGNHKSRVVYVKRTWAKEAKFVEFFSDTEDIYIPTINLQIPNTETGHCAKTLAIIKHYLDHEELKNVPWLVIADDDTLLSVHRLHRLLNCLPNRGKIILGERYGFGFDWDGVSGYDYPTGGAGMVFSREAARHLAFSCDCPQENSPDDMIIGMCARRLSIPVLHSAAFHQASRLDYAPDYVNKLPPISFHKFDRINPYDEYVNHLQDLSTAQHTEL